MKPQSLFTALRAPRPTSIGPRSLNIAIQLSSLELKSVKQKVRVTDECDGQLL